LRDKALLLQELNRIATQDEEEEEEEGGRRARSLRRRNQSEVLCNFLNSSNLYYKLITFKTMMLIYILFLLKPIKMFSYSNKYKRNPLLFYISETD
jgi:hypothetical protein